MNSAQARNAYRQTESQAKIHPVKLIHMMYERILQHLDKAKSALAEGNIQERGEHLGKSIALITELNASIKEDDNSEAAIFLRGLYSAILTELPKVSLSGDVQVLDQARTYILRLKEVWEKTAMAENKIDINHQDGNDDKGGVVTNHPHHNGTGKTMAHGLSVAI